MFRPLLPALLLAACGPDPLAPTALYGGDDDAPVHELLVLPNLDDDRGNDRPDWETPNANAEDDEVLGFSFRRRSLRGSLELRLEGGPARVWARGEVVLRRSGDTFVIDADWADEPLYVEVGAPGVDASLVLTQRNGRGNTRRELTVPVRGAPLVLGHHLQPAQELWVTEIPQFDPFWNNVSMVESYRAIFGDALTAIASQDVGFDPWVQDEIEVGTFQIPGQDRTVFLDSVRDGGLDTFAKSRLDADVAIVRWGDPDFASTFDSFGNLEASPPVEVDGVSYPLGRIYLGDDGTFGPVPALVDGLDAQRVQAPIHLDSAWLCVAHVDEFVSFVPDASSPKGFRVVWADPMLAFDILDELPPGTALPRYAPVSFERGHGRRDVGSIAGDAALRAYNEDLVADHLEPQWRTLVAELGLTESDRISVPMIYQPLDYCEGAAGSLTPGLVNLVMLDVGAGPKVVMPDPYIRPDPDDPTDDPFIDYVRASFPPELDVHFVDNWYVYHLGGGEVHCGTNERRVQDVPWWEDAAHLLPEGPE